METRNEETPGWGGEGMKEVENLKGKKNCRKIRREGKEGERKTGEKEGRKKRKCSYSIIKPERLSCGTFISIQQLSFQVQMSLKRIEEPRQVGAHKEDADVDPWRWKPSWNQHCLTSTSHFAG